MVSGGAWGIYLLKGVEIKNLPARFGPLATHVNKFRNCHRSDLHYSRLTGNAVDYCQERIMEG